jgi:hypothetical protein
MMDELEQRLIEAGRQWREAQPPAPALETALGRLGTAQQWPVGRTLASLGSAVVAIALLGILGRRLAGPSTPAGSTPAPLPALAKLTESPPPGTLLKSASGTGEREVTFGALGTEWHKVTIRFACTGDPDTAVRVTDLSGGWLMSVSGCDGWGRYGVSLTNAVAAKSGIHLDGGIRVDAGTAASWVIAVWVE